MLNYRILNLPEDPFIRPGIFEEILPTIDAEMRGYDTVYLDVDKLIKPEIVKTFRDLGALPLCVVLMYRENNRCSIKKTQEQSKIHSDLIGVDDHYVQLPCAINWEITPGDTYFKWWDTKNVPEIWPETAPVKGKRVYYLKSIFYKDVNNFDYSQYECIESIKFDKPMLVRTDVPHCVTYDSGDQIRLSISIRFSYNSISSWEQALALFNPIMD